MDHTTKVIITFLIFVVGEKIKNLQKGLFVSFPMLYLSVLTDRWLSLSAKITDNRTLAETLLIIDLKHMENNHYFSYIIHLFLQDFDADFLDDWE